MYKVVSLFSGGGGLDLGFISGGFKIIWATDIDKNAVASYKYNLGDHIFQADITKIDIECIPKADVVIGGPPCQSFSLIGKRQSEDERGRLVWRYFEIIETIKPKVFVFENVTGLLSAKDKDGNKVLDMLVQAFKKLGYFVHWQILNAADYGVPQRRRRVIVVGTQFDRFSFPIKSFSEDGSIGCKYISVKEALDDLPIATEKDCSIKYKYSPRTEYQRMMRENTKEVNHHFRPTTSKLDDFIIEHVKPGGNYMDVPSDVPSERIRRLQKTGGHTTCYGRLSANEPSYTINTYFNRPNVGCNIHYSYNRLITVREALRLQSFPDDYVLITSSKQAMNTIVGNAVPPLLAKKIANSVHDYLEECYYVD